MLKNWLNSFLLAFLLVACSESSDPEPVVEITATNLGFDVHYDDALGTTVYPSMILALRELTDEGSLFSFSAFNATDEPVTVMITVAANVLIEQTTVTQSIQPGENELELKLNWDFESLKSLLQPGSANFAYSVSIDGDQVTTTNKTLGYRAVTECVYGFKDENGDYVNTGFMFAAYVNEDNPKIDEFLSESLTHDLVSQYKGYQGTVDEVITEVFSIWYQLQKNDTKYSNITTTSNASSTVFSQNVRLFDQVFENSSANCVDGSAFISSILLRIGIEPVLVLVPGHMFMGFYASAGNGDLTLLETTMVGNVDINDIIDSNDLQPFADNDYFTSDQIVYYNSTCNSGECDVEYMRKVISWNEFVKARDNNVDLFNENLSKFNDPDNKIYQVFDIAKLRTVISPI